MKFQLLLLAAAFVLPWSVQASECDADLAQVEAQFTSTNPLAPETILEAMRLRDEAVTHCAAGDPGAGLNLLAQAKQLLGI